MNFSGGRQGGCGRTPRTPLNPPLRQTWPVTRDGSPPLQVPVPSFPRAPCYNFTQFPVVGNAAASVRTEQFGGDLSAFDDQLLCSAIVQLLVMRIAVSRIIALDAP